MTHATPNPSYLYELGEAALLDELASAAHISENLKARTDAEGISLCSVWAHYTKECKLEALRRMSK